MFIVPVSRHVSRSPRAIDRLFDDTFDRFFGAATTTQGTVRPALDVAETETHYTVTLDLPGVAKEDVKVSIEGKRLNIEAQAVQAKVEAQPEGETAPKAEAQRVLYRERSVARYARSIVLPAEPEQSASSAKLENGVLTLTLAKKRSAQPSLIEIK